MPTRGFTSSARTVAVDSGRGQFDFAKDLFPLMLEKGMRLFAFEDAGYWCDIGDLATYVSCQRICWRGGYSAV
ncbi:MAG: hypothetical protein ACLSAP_09270 [Oscillospiraceae bacterium]